MRIGLSVKRDETPIKKKRNKLRHKSERIRIKIILSNIHEIRETTIYKRLSRRLTLQEMNTIK